MVLIVIDVAEHELCESNSRRNRKSVVIAMMINFVIASIMCLMVVTVSRYGVVKNGVN